MWWIFGVGIGITILVISITALEESNSRANFQVLFGVNPLNENMTESTRALIVQRVESQLIQKSQRIQRATQELGELFESTPLDYDRIEELKDRLDCLEADLDSMLESAKRHGVVAQDRTLDYYTRLRAVNA
jgi:hypothetical protein